MPVCLLVQVPAAAAVTPVPQNLVGAAAPPKIGIDCFYTELTLLTEHILLDLRHNLGSKSIHTSVLRKL